MSWNKVHNRRAFLGGMSAMITLPFLESLPSSAATANTTRLVFWYLPCGVVMDRWRPSALGSGFELSEILAPLAPVQHKLNILSGLKNEAAIVPVAGDHARGTGSFLTCQQVKLTDGNDINNQISIDQVVANHLAGSTPLPSLELGTTGGASFGSCDSGYSCAYVRNISWANETTPLPKITEPSVAFDRMFAGVDASLSEADRARRRLVRSSILDHTIKDAKALSATLSAPDQARLEEYLDGVRQLEVRIEEGATSQCAVSSRPLPGLQYEERVKAMIDLQVLALQCNQTPVITFMMENGGSDRTFPSLGINNTHHDLSHHQGDLQKIEALATINHWEMQMLAELLRKLDQIPENNGKTLLDNCLVFASSEISDGDAHNHTDLPVLLAGTAAGAVRAGMHREFLDRTIADLFLAMAKEVGVNDRTFGLDGTDPLDLS